jgi:tRNA(His) guanylyltransferase
MFDKLGDRIKRYEQVTRSVLMRRGYTVLRCDGKAFHTYARGLEKPFDDSLIEDMDATAKYLCENIQGAKFAYVQSDEISVLLTDFEEFETQAWFDGNVQKMASISASLATAIFNQRRAIRHLMTDESLERMNDLCQSVDEKSVRRLLEYKLAHFDSRVFQLPYKTEVSNYFRWRQQDAVRNSIASVAQSLYSAKELHGVGQNEQQELIFQKGVNWNDYTARKKRGGFIDKVYYEKDGIERSKWEVVECPTFTQDAEFLLSRIPDTD